ncbi:MAG: orotidine-5'-phosphate decarboxylase [Planctomycetes bacterium]|nr:orotidine-5'-phosphate decarboxylase [Planctomycetota bacterium]
MTDQQAAIARHFADRFLHAIREKNAPVCVGLDPAIERLPKALLAKHAVDPGDTHGSAAVAAIHEFCREVIDVVAPHVPAVKINIAFFERFYAEGVRAYSSIVKHARDAGLIVIGDVKRADIGHSTAAYADAQLSDARPGRLPDGAIPDAVTVNPYFGFDGIEPFVRIAREQGKGLFVLVQTSNPSAGEVQGVVLSDGTQMSDHVGSLVQRWASAAGLVGSSGYSAIGAVVSPRDLPSTKRLRTLMPNCLFLVPGFGAQGRTAGEVAECFKPDGTGAIVAASRSVIYAYDGDAHKQAGASDWRCAVEAGCKEFVRAIRTVLSDR